MEHQVAHPSERKRGAINEDPFGGNVRVKVKVEPKEAMLKAESPSGRFGMQLRPEAERSVRRETQGVVKEEPIPTVKMGESPVWWIDGFRPTGVKEERHDGLEAEPMVAADGEQEFHRFGEEVAPKSTFEPVREKGNRMERKTP